MNKKVTVVIPIYNSEKYIERCIDSVLNQSVNIYNILLINDGSIDNSQKIIERYKKKYPEIIDVVNQKNIGVANTRNKAIKIAKTKYIMFVDNDDYIDKEYIETFYNSIKNSKYKVVIGGYKRTDQFNNVLFKISLSSDYYWDRLKVITPWARIFDREFLLKNNIKFLDNNIGEDIYLDLILNFITDDIKVIDYAGYNWFYNNESVSNTIQKKYNNLNVFNFLNSCYDELEKRNLLESNYEKIEAFFYRYIIWFLCYTTKKLSYKKISKIYDELLSWIKIRFPKYYKTKYISLINLKNETFKERIIYYLFKKFDKLKIGKLYLYMFNKRKNI